MEGLDFAFYSGRSKYHTKYDSVPGTVGGQMALWAMMEAVRGAGSALLNDDSIHTTGKVGEGEGAVYFDREYLLSPSILSEAVETYIGIKYSLRSSLYSLFAFSSRSISSYSWLGPYFFLFLRSSNT
jgi:hypothetical protein